MKNKNVLIICTSLNMGGAEKKAVWLANQLSKEFKVYFFSLKSSGVLSESLDNDVIVKNYNLVRSKNIISKLYYVFVGWFRLVKTIRDEEIQTVISFLFHSNLYAKLAKVFSQQKFLHIIAVRSDRLSKRGSNQNIMRMLVFKYFIIDKNSKIVFNSKAGVSKFNINKRYDQKLIYNSPENIPDSNIVKNNKFIYVGRLDELKNTTELIKAINHLKSKGYSIKIDIYGKGPNYSYLENFILKNSLEDQVFLKGIDPDISNKLFAYKCLILVSTHEGFPNVLIESMNSRINCISTKVGDAPYLLKDNRGILIDGFDYLSISRSIEFYLNLDKETKDKMADNSFEFVNKNLKEDDIISEWSKLII